MLTQSWLNGVRNWFTQGTRTRTSSRNTMRRRQRGLVGHVSSERLEERLLLTTIVVTGTGDSLAVDGVVTLREALTSINNGANFNADVTGVGAFGVSDTINFSIVGAGVQTISPTSPLPTILNPVVINGYSQPLTSVNTLANSDNAVLLIELDGTGAGLGANGLQFTATSDGSTVTGLVINRFSGAGILVQSDDNTITGNFIGTDATGNAGASGTSGFGIGIDGGFRNTIGGTTPAARNIIGGNSDGINLNTGSQNNVIQGNFIGLGANGTTAVGNRLHGVALRGNGGLGVQNNEIGGIVAGAGNTIANSGAAGVAVFGDAVSSRLNVGNTILGNSIFSNGLNSPTTLLGIDLVGATSYPTDDGVTLNDLGDADSGPNLLQNYPVLTSATSNLVSTTIVGTLNSKTNETYRVEFFSNAAVSGTGFGEGQTFLGFTNVTTDASGNASFSTILPTSVPSGLFITATATSGGVPTGTPATGAALVLGSAANFAVLAGSTVTVTGSSAFIGDVGVSPGTVIAGTFTTTGTVHSADAVSAQAQADLATGYNALAAMSPFIDLTGTDLGTLVLTPGVYHFNTSAQLTGTLTLDTLGDPHALFVFQIGSTLTTSVGSSVVVLGGPDDNIFWQVGSSATIGVGTAFVGNIVALTSITLETGATLTSGRALARNGAVTLDTIIADSTTVTQNSTSEFSAPRQIPLPNVTLAIAPASIAEAAGTATVTATLSAVSGQDVTVNLAFSGTATNVGDYVRSGVQIVILAGSTSGTVTLTAVQDLLDETNETIVVDISSVTNGIELGTQQDSVTITDDDAAPTVTLAILPTIIAEAAGTTTVTATLSAISGQDVTVDLAFSGTATNVSDYTRSGTQIVILAGSISGSVTVTAVQDLLDEANETVVVEISGVTNGTEFGTQLDTVTITDDDAAPTVTLAIAPASIGEAAGTATVTATLSAISGQNVTVDLAFSGTATNVSDYVRSGVQIVILAGSTSGTVTLTAVQDLLDESNETVVVDISNVTNGTEFGIQQDTVTITDDDAAPNVTLAIAPANIAEAAGTATVTATLSAISGQDVTVNLAFSGTATNISDYLSTGAQIVILAGSTSGSVTLTAVQDLLDESNETIVVDISSVINGNEVGTQQDSVTITDDDAAPTVTLLITPTTIVEAAGTTTATATLSAISGQDVTVDLGFSGTATNVSDYARSGTQIVITAGSLTGSVTLTAVQDTLAESNETIVVSITSVTNGTELGTQFDTVTITDDDSTPTVTLAIAPSSIAEAAGTATVTATLSAISGQNVTVDLAFSGTATNVSDYVRSGVQIVILAGSTSGTVTLLAVQDLLDEANETITVDISNVTNGTELGTQQDTVTITDDDAAPSVTLAIAPANITEAAGTATATATLSAISGQDVTVNLAFSGTATIVGDYTSSGVQIVILAGNTSGSVTVTAVQDLLDETNETVVVDINSVINGTELGTQQDTVTITDDDAAPTVTLAIAPTTIVEAAGTATVTATLSAVSAQNVTVDLAFSGTATNISDYVRSSTQIVILAGSLTGTATVIAVQDLLDETNETVVVDISGVTNGTELGTQFDTVTITDDDSTPTVTLAIAPATIAEAAGTATVTATLSTISGQNVIVDLAFSGTATNLSDYVSSGVQIVILAGSTSGTVTLLAVQDLLDEASESIVVDISNVTNGTELGTQQDTVTITDDDAAPSVTLAIAPANIAEAAGTATATATLSAISGQDVTVNLAFSGTATIIGDYTSSGVQIVILAGNTSGSVTVTAVQDALVETNETVVVDISSVINGTELGTQQDTVTIIDDDTPPSVTLAAVPASVAEAGGIATVTATLSAVSSQNVTVDLAFSGTATNLGDYVRTGTQIVILAGSLTGTVTLTAVQDLLDETNETIVVDISGVTNGTELGTQQTTVTITDDDATPTLSVNDVSVVEGNLGVTTAVFTITLSAASGQTVTVVATSADDTATTPSDYFAIPPTLLTFAPGETSKSVTVLVRGDTVNEANETYFVILSSPSNATIADALGQGTITNDDAAPTLSINNVTVSEGDLGTTSAVFTVTLSAASGQIVTVVATTADDAATAPFDYINLLPTTLTFAPGETTKTVTVVVNSDTLPEADETYFVNLTAAVNATVTDNQGLGTIVDDDIDHTRQSGFVGLVDDPQNPGQKMLLVNGTIGNDTLHFQNRRFSQDILVRLNGVNVGVFAHDTVSRIVAYGLAGNDHIRVYLALGKTTELHGDEGNDTVYGGIGRDELFGGEGNDYLNGRSGLDRLYGEDGNDRLYGENGHDILLGGLGDDSLHGGNDRDILIGGEGTDKLYGEGGDDILLGGTTDHDDNAAALVAILTEWTSGNSYETRVANIRDGLGQSDGFSLSSDVTAFDDGVVDELFGGGNQDWFFNFGAENDKLKDKKSTELVN